MKDALLDTLLDTIREEALRLGSEFIRQGIGIAQDRLSGKVSDAAILEHLAAVQAKEVGQ